MKKLFAIVMLAALAYGGYWFFMASLRESLFEDWLAERRADGWIAEARALDVRGFPNRIDTFVEGLALADPDQGWQWNAEAFQLLSLSWKPNHLIAAWPGRQIIGTPYETIELSGEVLRGSVVVRPTPRLPLDRTTIEIGDLSVTGGYGWNAGIVEAIFAVRAEPDVEGHAYRFGLDAKGLTPPNAWREEFPGANALPRRMQSLYADAVVTFDRAWDRVAVEEENPAILEIDIDDARASWGKLDLRAEGVLTTDAEGFAEGSIRLRARNWRQMLQIAETRAR